jgi:hypothetical protein
MSLPIVWDINFSLGMQLVVAIFLGMGFGFALERAGFGNAKNIVAIFYLRDFRVLRVMFTAIVTSMLGLYLLDLSGLMPIGRIGILDTYFLPQLVGGILLGFGFIIGGYCPGTSIVAAVSGKIDSMIFLFSIGIGSFIFTIAYDTIQPFHNSTHYGRVLLSDFLGIPAGVVVFGVVLMAIGAFIGAGKVEEMVNKSLGSVKQK